MGTWSTERFDHLPSEKKTRVIEAAIDEFATNGYQSANTNRIAAAAGISVGALFKYFANKDDLFRYIIDLGASEIEQQVGSIVHRQVPIMDRIRALLEVIVATSPRHRQFVLVYHEATATGNKELSHELALQIETFASQAYTALMKEGQDSGEIRTDLPAKTLALMLDNHFMTLQFGLSSEYYKERMSRYLSGEPAEIIDQSMTFLAGALGRPSC